MTDSSQSPRMESGDVERPAWLGDTTHKDWLWDGVPIRGVLIAKFAELDWSRAWVDMGPSIAGNPGPYWHVPYPPEDTVHRLYPKLLMTKWLPIVRQAVDEVAKRARRKPTESEGKG
jgi:hypothetical protein